MLRLLCRAGEAHASAGKDHFGIRGMHSLIGRTMENNGANTAVRALETNLPLRRHTWTSGAAHGGKCGSHIGGGPIGEAGMNSRRGV